MTDSTLGESRDQQRARVEELFARGARCSLGAGVEQEFFAVDLASGASVAPERVSAAVDRRYASWVSFEPGGQVELSLPRAAGPSAATAHLVKVTGHLASDLMKRGIVLEARPVRAKDRATPRYLNTPRYDAMERHFDRHGPAGRRMMRATAATQVCLDWWPGSAGMEQWRLLLLAAPFLAAATALSSGPDGRLTTWLAVDPTRTAFDDRLLHGDDPITAYASFAAAADVFVDGGFEEHLTTLFPPIRPRGRYLEIRFPDSRPAEEVGTLVSGLAALLYDDERRRCALATVAPEQHRLADRWQATAAGTLDPSLGQALLDGAELRRRVPV